MAGGIYRCLGATAQLRLRAAEWDPCASGVDALKLAKVSGLCRERVQVQRSVSPRPLDTLRHRPRSNSPARSLLEKPQPSVATSGSRQPRRTRWKNCSPSIPLPASKPSVPCCMHGPWLRLAHQGRLLPGVQPVLDHHAVAAGGACVQAVARRNRPVRVAGRYAILLFDRSLSNTCLTMTQRVLLAAFHSTTCRGARSF